MKGRIPQMLKAIAAIENSVPVSDPLYTKVKQFAESLSTGLVSKYFQ